jgi:hypothetical protein
LASQQGDYVISATLADAAQARYRVMVEGPREAMMFIQDGHVDAETHVLGDDHSSSVALVGEFQLR